MPHQPCTRLLSGGETAVLFVHGILGTPDHFSPFLSLVPPEYSVINLLLEGHGGSVRVSYRTQDYQPRDGPTHKGTSPLDH